MEMPCCLKYIHTWTWTLALSLGHNPSTLKAPQRALLAPGTSSNSTKLLPGIPRISVCFTNVKQSCTTSLLRALTLRDPKIRILELLVHLIKTLSNSNFSRQVSRVYLSIHVAIFTLLASLPGWEHQHQLYVFILHHSSVLLPCFLQTATHRAAFLPSGV